MIKQLQPLFNSLKLTHTNMRKLLLLAQCILMLNIQSTIIAEPALYRPEKTNMHSISSFITEHKKTIAVIAVGLGLGIAAKQYICANDLTEQNAPKLITLNATESQPHTVYLFAHGIDPRSSTALKQPAKYIEQGAITSTCYTFSFNDRIATLNFGQERDSGLLYKAYQEVRQKHPKSSIVLVGISRGASTIINMLAQGKSDWSPIKAVILESPYLSVDSLLQHISSSYVFYIPYSATLLKKLVSTLPLYDPKGIQTISAVQQFPQTIPAFVSYSKKDKTVSPHDGQEIVRLLRAQGNHVVEYAAKEGRHSTLSNCPAYAKAVRTFLDVYELPTSFLKLTMIQHIIPPRKCQNYH